MMLRSVIAKSSNVIGKRMMSSGGAAAKKPVADVTIVSGINGVDSKSALGLGLGIALLVTAGITSQKGESAKLEAAPVAVAADTHHDKPPAPAASPKKKEEESESEMVEKLIRRITQRIDQIEHQLVIDHATKTNRAFVFIKPHAVNDSVKQLVMEKLKKNGVVITGEGHIPAAQIDAEMLIDNHYGAIASKAVKVKPEDLSLSPKAKAEFLKISGGMTWEDALAKGLVYNAKQACEKLAVDGEGLNDLWQKLSKGEGGQIVKFGGGFYCGRLLNEDAEKGTPAMYVINGFYMSMRGKYTVEPASIQWFTVEWDPRNLSWSDFRGKLLGATDPKEAKEGSIRRLIYENWQALGLTAIPDTGDNGVHASASPFEATAERMNWTKQTLENDPFGKAMLLSNIPSEILSIWLQDAQVKIDGKSVSIFDLLEDSDAEECLKKLTSIEIPSPAAAVASSSS